MADGHREIEVRYCAPTESELPSFEDLDDVSGVDQPVTQHLVEDYFDTDDLRLAGLGVSLCRRDGSEGAGWHLAVPHGDGRYELRAADNHDPAPPAAFQSVLAGVARRRRLTPVVKITTARELFCLRDPRGGLLAVVADNRVDAASPVPGIVAAAWREWVVELADGDAGLLRRVCQEMEQLGAERASHSSALAKALDDSLVPFAAEPPKRTRTHQSAQGVVRARLRDQVRSLLRWDILVRHDVEDSVHQMRVTVRRLRSALATYRPMLDRGRTEPVRSELKWLGSLLGAVRDAEVMHDRIGELAAGEDPELLDTRTISSAQDELSRRYRESHRRLVQEMRSARYASLVHQLERLVSDLPWSSEGQGKRPGALRKRVRHDWKRVVAAVASADEAPDDETRLERLHEARKAAKRVRYAAEPLVPNFGSGAKRFLKATEKVQRTLGDLNDAVLTREELQHLADSETARGHNAFTLGILHARQSAESAEREDKFETAWRRARRKKVLRWLR